MCCVGRHWAFSNTLCRASWCWGAQCIRTLGAASQRSSIRRESANRAHPPGRKMHSSVAPSRGVPINWVLSVFVLPRRGGGGSQWPGEQGSCQVSVKQTTGQSIDDGTRSRTKLAEENQRRIRAYVGPGTWTVEHGRVGRGGIWDTIIIRNGMGIVGMETKQTDGTDWRNRQARAERESETWNKGPTRVAGACMRVRLRPRLI